MQNNVGSEASNLPWPNNSARFFGRFFYYYYSYVHTRLGSFLRIFFFSLWYWGLIRASCLWHRCATTWATFSALFALVNLEIGSRFLPRPARSLVLLLMLSTLAGMIFMHHYAQPLVEMGFWQTFCPSWPQTASSKSKPPKELGL
jgi:hypothetical protein